MADRDDQLPWSALTFVLAAGGVALLFVGIGWWLANRRPGPALMGSPQLAGGMDYPTFQVAASAAMATAPLGRSRDSSARPDVEQAPYIEAFSVGTSAVEVVSRVKSGRRRVQIASDQPIRISNGRSVATAPERGLPISAGDQPYDLGILSANARFFAVVAPGGSAANVSVISQIVSD